MSLTQLPDVVLIKIFRILDHVELVRLYLSLHSSMRLQNLIRNSSCLWTRVHIQSTVDYYLFVYFCRLLMLNAPTTRELIVDELDLICRKLLYDNEFSLKKFLQLEQLTIHDEYICNTITSLNFCSLTLKLLCLTGNHINLNHVHCLHQLNSLQLSFHSINILENKFEQLTNLNLKIMFDYDYNSHEIFSRLPSKNLQIFTLTFLLLNNDFNFLNQFNRYLYSCFKLHTLTISYLHGMCPLSIYAYIIYSKYRRIILNNICELSQMKSFVELNGIDLPPEYLQSNSTLNFDLHSSYIRTEFWCGREVISLDYIQCATTSVELLNNFNIIWSDKDHVEQSFESYILRSIYNAPYLIYPLRKIVINKFEMSLNGLITLMTSLPLMIDFTIECGKIDQMGAGISNIEKILNDISHIQQSNMQSLIMNNIQLSPRTTVHLCLITENLLTLTMNNVRILDKIIINEKNYKHTRPSFLVLLRHVAQVAEHFKWNQMKSLTIGQNMISRQNLLSFVPSNTNQMYSSNVNHLRIIVNDHTLFEIRDIFQKAIKSIMKMFTNLTSFAIEFTNQYEGQFRLRNQLKALLEMTTNKNVYVYPTAHDYAWRFCFYHKYTGENIDDNDDKQINSSQNRRTFCGLPLFRLRRRRKSNVFA